MRVIVVGAGLAGLVAAHRMKATAVDVLVLEARPRLGGRTYTVRDGFAHGQHADLGAELVDEGQSAIIGLCAQLGLELTPEFTLVRGEVVMGGRLLGVQERERILDELSTARRSVPPAPGELLASWVRRASLSAQARGFARACAEMNPMCSPRDIDSHILFEVPSGRRAWRIRGGSDCPARRLGEEVEVELEAPVRLVTQDRESVTVETDGGRYTADAVVLAVPAAVLADIGFDPPLPEAKVRSLLALRYGVGGKAIAQYAEGDELRERLARGCISDSALCLIWNTAAHQPGPTAVVSALVGGDSSDILRDAESALEELDSLTASLLGHPATRLHGLVQDWSREEFTRCTVSVPWADRFSLVPVLAASFGRLYFAGEHTDLEWPGYMEGAVRSGVRAAREVVAAHSPR
jgi:monoamine oxidase